MSDLSAVVLFFTCLGLTFALVRVCAWLQPQDTPSIKDPASNATIPETYR